MIAVFVPALMLQIFTTYFIIKVIIFGLPVSLFTFFDFFFWNAFLVGPVTLVIYFGSMATSKGRKLSSCIGKFSNYISDDCVAQKVV